MDVIESIVEAFRNMPTRIALEINGGVYHKQYRHEFPPPAVGKKPGVILLRLGVADRDLITFYEQHDGATLFHNADSDDLVEEGRYKAPAVLLYPVERIPTETAFMLAQVDEEMENDPDWAPPYRRGITIGEATVSGAYFVLVTHGVHAGKIYYADTDVDDNDWPNTAFAASFSHFLDKFLQSPFVGLCDLSGADAVWLCPNSDHPDTSLPASTGG